MANSFQPSFVPKTEDIKHIKQSELRIQRISNFLFSLVIVIFILAVAGAAGSIMYKQYLAQSIKSSQEIFNKKKSQFGIDTVNKLSFLNDRLKMSEELLKEHKAFSPFFEELEKTTLSNVNYTSLVIERSSDGIYNVTGRGITDNFESIALQSDAFFQKSNYFKNPVFSGFVENEKKQVSFEIAFSVDSSLLSYKTVVERNNQ